jgi:threonine dehydrogenase-like Zn-dependent dehydrogenase
MLVTDVPDPEPGPGEVLVATRACGICGSDLHIAQHAQQHAQQHGHPSEGLFGLDFDRDVVMGHEFAAEILDYGPAASKRLPVGALVCSVPWTRHHGRRENIGYSHALPGGYSERMVLAEDLLLAVPNGLSATHAALTEPMAVGVHAVAMARLTADDVALVIGCGPVGLAVIAALRLAGVRPIVAADYSSARRRLAAELGADVVIDPAERSPYTSWQELAAVTLSGEQVAVNPLSGERALRPGVFFECVGVPGVLDQMMAGARHGCRVVVVGVCMQADTIRPMLGITRELSLQFVLAYSVEEFSRTLRHIAEGELPVTPLISAAVDIAEVPDAFAALGRPAAHCKVLVQPGGTTGVFA